MKFEAPTCLYIEHNLTQSYTISLFYMAAFNPKASEVVHTAQFEHGMKGALILALTKHNIGEDIIQSIITDSVKNLRNIVDYNQIPPPRPPKCAFDFFKTREINKDKAMTACRRENPRAGANGIRNEQYNQKIKEIWDNMPQNVGDNDDLHCWETKAYWEDQYQERIEAWDAWKLQEKGSSAYQVFIDSNDMKHPSLAWEALSDTERQAYVEQARGKLHRSSSSSSYVQIEESV